MLYDAKNSNLQVTVKIVLLIGLILLIILNFSGVVKGLKTISGVFSPLVLGAAMAYVLNLLVSGYEKIFFPSTTKPFLKNSRLGVSIFLSLLTVALTLLFFLLILIPQFQKFTALLLVKMPVLYEQVVNWLMRYTDQLPALRQQLEQLNIDGANAVKRSLEVLSIGAGGMFFLVGAIFSRIVNFVLAGIFAVYMLFYKEELKATFDKILKTTMKTDRRAKIHFFLRVLDESFASYIVGQCKEAVILGLLCTIGMGLFRFPYATTIGPVIGLTALIPLIGAFLGAAVGFLLIVMVNPVQAVMFIVFIVVLQQIEGNFIYPKVVGESIGLPGIWVLVAITIGGGLMGITGTLLAVPVFATFYKLLDKAASDRNRLARRNKEAAVRRATSE